MPLKKSAEIFFVTKDQLPENIAPVFGSFERTKK